MRTSFSVCGSPLENSYLKDSDLKILAAASVRPQFMQKPKKQKSKREYLEILKKDGRYSDDQIVTLLLKAGTHEASCRSCKFPIGPGTLCFAVEGALAVDYGSEKAIPRKFYFCANHCINMQAPAWTNIRSPFSFLASPEVKEEDRQKVEQNCRLVCKS